MFAIVQTLVTGFFRLMSLLGWLVQWIAYFIKVVWGAGVFVLQQVINLSVSIIAFVFQMVTDVFLFILTMAVSILPMMPEGPDIGGGLDLNQVNRYIPFTELTALSAFWVVIFGSIGAYKLAKFVRGGG